MSPKPSVYFCGIYLSMNLLILIKKNRVLYSSKEKFVSVCIADTVKYAKTFMVFEDTKKFYINLFLHSQWSII